MTTQLDAVAAFVSTSVCAFLGSQAFPLLADAAPEQTPEWVKLILGPLGALVGTIAAIIWLTKKLNKAEEKADSRESERDNDRKALITVLVQNTSVLEQNSSVMRDVQTVMAKNHQ